MTPDPANRDPVRSEDAASHESAANAAPPPAPSPALSPASGPQLPPPGLAAIALYLLLLAGTIILGVASGGHYPPLFLAFSALFIAASAGLLLLFRWAWALALAAVLLLSAYNFYVFSRSPQLPSALVQGMLNLVFFLYLTRTEVRKKLR
jgi:hypothetical protein